MYLGPIILSVITMARETENIFIWSMIFQLKNRAQLQTTEKKVLMKINYGSTG